MGTCQKPQCAIFTAPDGTRYQQPLKDRRCETQVSLDASGVAVAADVLSVRFDRLTPANVKGLVASIQPTLCRLGQIFVATTLTQRWTRYILAPNEVNANYQLVEVFFNGNRDPIEKTTLPCIHACLSCQAAAGEVLAANTELIDVGHDESDNEGNICNVSLSSEDGLTVNDTSGAAYTPVADLGMETTLAGWETDGQCGPVPTELSDPAAPPSCDPSNPALTNAPRSNASDL